MTASTARSKSIVSVIIRSRSFRCAAMSMRAPSIMRKNPSGSDSRNRIALIDISARVG